MVFWYNKKGITNHIIPEEETHWVAPAFLVKIVDGEVKNMEPEKHGDVRWFSLDHLPEDITLTTKKALEYLNNMIRNNFKI